MNNNKIKSINKRLETIFKDLKTMPFKEINKILFNIELLKNKYLYRIKQDDLNLYEEINIKEIIKQINER